MTTPSTAWTENIAPDEAARFTALGRVLVGIQEEVARRRDKGRALHYKAHGGLRAELAIAPDVPAWARVGIFEKPGSYRAFVRFSNGSWLPQKDAAADVRGIAVKLLGVPGRKLIDGLRDASTQDFLAVLTPSLPFRTPEQFVGVVRAGAGPKWLALPRIFAALGWRTFGVLSKAQQGLAIPLGSVCERTFYSAAPIKWGDYAAKYAFVPQTETNTPANKGDKHFLGTELAARVKQGSVVFDLRVQGFVSEQLTPIEDVTREWLPEHAPWVTVARLTIAQQDPASADGQKLAGRIEKMSFDPWHAPEPFRPLGSMMRARMHAYRESVIARGASPEPAD